MRRSLATLALVAATTAVPLGTLCEWQCAREALGAAAATPSCHEVESPVPAPSSGPGVAADAEHCDAHDQLPAVTGERQFGRSTGATMLGVVVSDTHAPALAVVPTDIESSPPDLSPPRERISVLRI